MVPSTNIRVTCLMTRASTLMVLFTTFKGTSTEGTRRTSRFFCARFFLGSMPSQKQDLTSRLMREKQQTPCIKFQPEFASSTSCFTCELMAVRGPSSTKLCKTTLSSASTRRKIPLTTLCLCLCRCVSCFRFSVSSHLQFVFHHHNRTPLLPSVVFSWHSGPVDTFSAAPCWVTAVLCSSCSTFQMSTASRTGSEKRSLGRVVSNLHVQFFSRSTKGLSALSHVVTVFR